MALIARGSSSNCANPLLDVFMSFSGILTDVSVLEFQIFDVSTVSKQTIPVQVYPETGRALVDLQACPTGDKLGTGHYVADWSVPENEPIGAHRIKWFFKLTGASPEQSYVEQFDVLVSGSLSSGDTYCTVQDLRDEGVTPEIASDLVLSRRIQLASNFIERATGQWFTPRSLLLKLDGRGGPMLLFNIPIISVASVALAVSYATPSLSPVDNESLRVYNRHLTQRLTAPDDRADPKIELIDTFDQAVRFAGVGGRIVFPRGQQNVVVDGVFGYTEFDANSEVGVTPFLINHVCKLIVMRELPKLVNVADRSEAAERYRLVSERTRDQAYVLEPLGVRVGGLFTGDPAIDNILASFMRPPSLGAT